MRLAFLIQSMNRSGGTERVAANLCSRWAAGAEITIIAIEPGEQSFYRLPPNVSVHSLAVERPSHVMGWLVWYGNVATRLRGLLKTLEPDILLGFATNPSCCAILATMGLGTQVFAYEHMYYGYYRHNAAGAMRTVYWLRRWLYPLATAVITLTNTDRKQFLPFCRHVAAIPNVVTNLDYQSQVIDYSRKRVIAVGRICPQKGFDRLLQVWSSLVSRYSDWELVIVGAEAPDEKRYCAEFLSMPEWQTIGDSVKILQPAGNILDYYRSASIYVMPSRWEGFPMVLLEAMASGLPVVSFDCPNGPGEMIVHGENGYLIGDGDLGAFAEHLALLMANQDLRERLGQSACRIRGDYCWERIAPQWEAAFAGVKAGDGV